MNIHTWHTWLIRQRRHSITLLLSVVTYRDSQWSFRDGKWAIFKEHIFILNSSFSYLDGICSNRRCCISRAKQLKRQYGFCLDTKRWRFNVFNLLSHRNYENVGGVRWVVATPYTFYCHNGSFFQPEGKPRATISTSGNVAKSLFILSSISLLGDMMSRKYLMMQIVKYTLWGFVGRVIQEWAILLGVTGMMELTLFHTLEWWQQAFRNKVKDVIQDSKTIGCKPK